MWVAGNYSFFTFDLATYLTNPSCFLSNILICSCQIIEKKWQKKTIFQKIFEYNLHTQDSDLMVTCSLLSWSYKSDKTSDFVSLWCTIANTDKSRTVCKFLKMDAIQLQDWREDDLLLVCSVLLLGKLLYRQEKHLRKKYTSG